MTDCLREEDIERGMMSNGGDDIDDVVRVSRLKEIVIGFEDLLFILEKEAITPSSHAGMRLVRDQFKKHFAPLFKEVKE